MGSPSRLASRWVELEVDVERRWVFVISGVGREVVEVSVRKLQRLVSTSPSKPHPITTPSSISSLLIPNPSAPTTKAKAKAVLSPVSGLLWTAREPQRTRVRDEGI